MPFTAKTPSGQGLRTALGKRDLRRVHRFIFRGKRIIYDMNSCAPFEVDRITWDVLEALSRSKKMDGELHRKYDEAALREVVARLTNLKNRGLLFSAFKPKPPVPSDDTTHLVLLTTYGCNLDCRYCYTKEESYAGQRTLMNEETARNAIDFLMRQSGRSQTLFIAFFGGEPLLNFPLIQRSVEYAKAQAKPLGKKLELSVTTNAVLLTKDVQKFLIENNIYVVASLDGPENLHDAQRPARDGSGSHAKALANLRELLAARGPYGVFIRGTFTRHTLPQLPDAASYLLRLGFRDISLEPAILPSDHAEATRIEDVAVVRQAYSAAAERYLQELLNRNVFLFQPFSFVMQRLHVPRRNFAHCGAGYTSMALAPTGELYPCIKMVGAEDVKLGDVREQIVNPRLRKLFQSAQVHNKKKCRACWAKYICGGGCHAHGLKYDNDLFGANEVECHILKCWFELGMWLYANLAKDAPDVLASVVARESDRRMTVT